MNTHSLSTMGMANLAPSNNISSLADASLEVMSDMRIASNVLDAKAVTIHEYVESFCTAPTMSAYSTRVLGEIPAPGSLQGSIVRVQLGPVSATWMRFVHQIRGSLI